MNAPTATPQPATADVAAPARRDLYAGIHKALRLFMTRTLCTIGATDPADDAAVAATLAMVERLLGLCELHLKDENEFMHPALERAQPGISARIAAEHVHHAESIADLRDLAGLVADCQGAPRAAALGRLYRATALFVGENLQHMHVEETVHNPVLWNAYGDEELVALEHRLVASIPPGMMMEAMHWFLPALHAGERAAMLGEMRQGMPPEPFRAVLEIARQTLDAVQHERLLRALDLPASA